MSPIPRIDPDEIEITIADVRDGQAAWEEAQDHAEEQEKIKADSEKDEDESSDEESSTEED